MNTAQSQSHDPARPGPAPAAQADLKRDALYVTLTTLVGAGASLAFYVYMWSQSRAWQLLALSLSVGLYIAIALASLALIRRGRVGLGNGLVLGGIVIVVLSGTLWVQGLGQILGFGVLLVMPLLVLQMQLPARGARWAIAANLLAGVAIILLDLFWPLPFKRLLVPGVQTLYPIIIATVAALALFLIVRQMPSYPLRVKLLVAFLLMILTPLVVQGFVNNYFTRAALLDAANDKLYAAAAQTANQLDTFISVNLDAIKTEAQLPEWASYYLDLPPETRSGSPGEAIIRNLLNTLQRKAQVSDLPNIHSYALLDRNGINLLDTYTVNVGKSEAERSYFRAAMQLGPGQSFVSPVEFSPQASEGYLHFSSPIFNAAQERVGVLRLSYNADILETQFIVQSTGLMGAGSFAILLDENRMHLAHGVNSDLIFKTTAPLSPERIAALRAELRLPARSMSEMSADLAEFDRALADASQHYFTLRLLPASDELYAVAVAPLRRQPWKIVFAQPQAAILAAVETQSRLSLLLALVIVGLVAGGATLVAQIFNAPISRLVQAAQKITAGDLSVRVRATTSDEMGVLANAFDAMTEQLSSLVATLEARVEARTAQLRASAQVARAASSILNPQELLEQTVDLICDQFGYYYAAIFLLDEEGQFARLRAGRGEAGRIMLERGHKFERGQGMVGWVCAHKRARIALDVGQDAVRFANPLLPNTRSEIALPLQVGDRILGALDVQSEQPTAFDDSDIAVLQGMADQIAVALENARLFDQAQASLLQNEQLIAQIQTSLKEATKLYAASQSIAAAQNSDDVFQAILNNIVEAEIELCLLILFDTYQTDIPQALEISHIWARSGQPGLPAGMRFEFINFPLRSFLRPDIPSVIGDYAQVPPDAPSQRMWAQLGVKRLAFVPLNIGARWLGALGLGAAGEYTFGEAELRPYQAVAGQVANALETRRLSASAQASLRELSTLYRAYTREAWATALRTRPELAEYEWKRPDAADQPTQLFRVPLTVRDQEIGFLELESSGRTWSDQERALVQAVSLQAAQALDSARLFEQTQRLAGRERLINEITAQIRAAGSVPNILETAARELAKAINVPHAVARIHLKDPEEKGQDEA